jgi:hypothetical protein
MGVGLNPSPYEKKRNLGGKAATLLHVTGLNIGRSTGYLD